MPDPAAGGEAGESARGPIATAGLVAGPVVFAIVVATGGAWAADLAVAARVTLGLAAWMAVWWLAEAVPLAVTALLPPAVLPLAPGAPGLREIAASFADPFILLFAGGFLLALAMERWNLHRRLALGALGFVGSSPRAIIGAFMVLSAGLSMWVSNTATAVMMLPIAISVIAVAERDDAAGAADAESAGDAGSSSGAEGAAIFARALLLGIAWACSIGGTGTLVGTPPNAMLASFLAGDGDPTTGIDFAEWLAVGLPVVVILLPVAWWVLVSVVARVPRAPLAGGRSAIRKQFRALGPVHRAEWLVAGVFTVTAAAWLFRDRLGAIEILGRTPLAGLSDAGIAIAAAIVLFVLPSGDASRPRLLDWSTARRLPWGVLILFGGGLALARAVTETGLDDWIGGQVDVFAGLPAPLIVALVVLVVVFATELCSNTALVAAALPVLAAVAGPLGVPPLMLLLPATIAASCAFMMPVATPPNAIVFGSGRLALRDMVRAGLVMNLISIVIITALAYGLLAGGLALRP